MTNIYISSSSDILEIDKIQDGCWINLTNPTEEEITFISKNFKLKPDFVNSALDAEECARIEFNDNDDMLVIVNIPICDLENEGKFYSTLPVGIIVIKKCIITICLKENLIIDSFIKGNIKSFFTYKKYKCVLQILSENTNIFLQYLRQINKQSEIIKLETYKSMRNKEIIQLLELENSLIYFATSLKSNELVIENLSKYDFMQKYPEDSNFLDSLIIENKQAIKMAKTYSDVLSGTMDSFTSIISNNLNIQMRFLTSITIIMSVPNMVFGLFGQNVKLPFQDNPFALIIIMILTFIICFILAKVMAKRNMF